MTVRNRLGCDGAFSLQTLVQSTLNSSLDGKLISDVGAKVAVTEALNMIPQNTTISNPIDGLEIVVVAPIYSASHQCG